MKKRMLPIALILALCLSLCANAATHENNFFRVSGDVSTSGTTATCVLVVNATKAGTNAAIDATIELEVRANSTSSYTQIDSWPVSGVGTLNFSDSCTGSHISSGNCRMHYTVTVVGDNGTDTVSGYVYEL